MTNIELVNTLNTIGAIMQKKLPVKLSYEIARNFNKLSEAYKTYDEERIKILERCAEVDEKGKPKRADNGEYIIAEKHKQEVATEINELLSIDCGFIPRKIAFSAIEGIDERYDALTPADIVVLEFMLED